MIWSATEIKKRREAQGLTQQQLADALGASRRAVISWESEGGSQPQGRFISQLERVLGDEGSSTGEGGTVLLRDAGFVETLQHLFDLYQKAERGAVSSTLSIEQTPLSPQHEFDHHVTTGPSEAADESALPLEPADRQKDETQVTK